MDSLRESSEWVQDLHMRKDGGEGGQGAFSSDPLVLTTVPALGSPRVRQGARYSLRENPQVKDPQYLYLSDSVSVPSSDEHSDAAAGSAAVSDSSAAIIEPFHGKDKLPVSQLGCFPPSQNSRASSGLPIDASYEDLKAEDSHLHAKPMKKFGRPLKHEGLADNPNLSEAENRRLRRRTANRESARRVRDRRSDHAGRLEKQVADVVTINGQLVQRCTCVDKEHGLASHLLDTFHSKLAALNSSNAGVAAEIAKLERAKAQGQQTGSQNAVMMAEFASISPFGQTAVPTAVKTEMPTPAVEGFTGQSQMTSALSGWHAQQEPHQGYPVPPQAPLSPFSFPAPASAVNQAHLPSLASSVQPPVTFMPEASAGPAQPLTPPVPPTLVPSDSIDDMLGLFNADESAFSMQRRSSLTLSQGLSAMLDFLHAHGDEAEAVL